MRSARWSRSTTATIRALKHRGRALDLYLETVLGWSFWQTGGFLAIWGFY
jgi:hypothetical protein